MSEPRGLVLAGGAGRRLGGPKADLRADGTSWAARAGRVLAPLCGDVRIAVRPGQAIAATGFATVEDPAPGGEGPLPAIGAALADAPGGLLVLACDYPALETPFFRALLRAAEAGDAVRLARDGAGRLHPLAAFWRPSAREAVERTLDAGERAVFDALESLQVGVSGPEAFGGLDLDAELRNVNRPDDLAAWRRAIAGTP